ncbi:hypothetical protein G5B00_14565 [Parapedobacter sp. SGR-10]|uniref:BNR-4 repeat-containing protein n=1 Tax=Parapedobacter sp. SGR-10 TaxID=2710879 RepID=UPI0013D33A99|nr:BNR-4 repeat-containing protein [Parapedobacter sp. SGR-10]NGF57739.1 hypothetical protein [Parapedobacter sp. SGR-10]
MANRGWMLNISIVLVLALYMGSAFAQSKWPEGVIGGLQHTGALHMYALPGPLTVDVYKRDFKTDAKIDRTAIVFLTGPDGSVLAQERIASPPGQWEGKEGPLQHIRFVTDVVHAGVYTVLITCHDDPYLRRNQAWGFATNAHRYVINAGTGHTDSRREEPILLYGERKPTSIFFKPIASTLRVSIEQIPAGAGTIELRDPTGKIVWKSDEMAGKVMSEEITDVMAGIWELKMPIARGKILIKGFNHEFEAGQTVLPIWSTSKSSYFDLENLHWLLSPRRLSRRLKPGEQGTLAFSVSNNQSKSITYDLAVRPDPGFPGKVNTIASKIQVSPKAVDTVYVDYQLDQESRDGTYQFALVVTDSATHMQAFSLGELRVERERTDAAITLPLQYRLFEHDQFQFAYEPDYPRDNEFYFDTKNNPWIVTSVGLKTLKNGEWRLVPLPGYASNEVDFKLSALGTDANGYVYGIAHLKQQPHIVRVDGETLQAEVAVLPNGGAYSIETSGTSIDTQSPPAIVRQVRDRTKKNTFKKTAIHTVELIVPEIRDGKLHVPPSIKVSHSGHGVSQHSGRPNLVVSDEDEVHLVWGEISQPEDNAPGVPVYTASYDRKSRKLSEKILVAYAPPVNDAHNTPSILMDGKQQRHIITGTHNHPFVYRAAKKGSDSWTDPVYVSDLEQTYVGAVPDQSGGIHLLYRIWQRGNNFPGLFQTALYYQYKSPSKNDWSLPNAFALPALPAYSVYRHRITRDRRDYLYVSMQYWSTWSPYRESYRSDSKRNQDTKTRINLISKDNGVTWYMLTDEDLHQAANISR